MISECRDVLLYNLAKFSSTEIISGFSTKRRYY